MSAARAKNLLKVLLQEASQFSDYNFRSHAIRRATTMYQAQIENAKDDEASLVPIIQSMEKDLAVTERQVTIGKLYRAERHLLDHQTTD